jgi:hypothetical protein
MPRHGGWYRTVGRWRSRSERRGGLQRDEGGRRKQLEGAEVSGEGDCRPRVTDVDVALPHAVYTGVQMLEIHPKSATLCHFLDRPARLRGGTARSARCCSIMRSDMTRARPGHLKTEWHGCTESARPNSADCSLSQTEQSMACLRRRSMARPLRCSRRQAQLSRSASSSLTSRFKNRSPESDGFPARTPALGSRTASASASSAWPAEVERASGSDCFRDRR